MSDSWRPWEPCLESVAMLAFATSKTYSLRTVAEQTRVFRDAYSLRQARELRSGYVYQDISHSAEEIRLTAEFMKLFVDLK